MRALARRGGAPLLVLLALTLGLVLVAPAAPAGAYVNPYGRYLVMTPARQMQCLTVPGNGGHGTWVIREFCGAEANANWHFDRVGTYWGDPVFEIRATHRPFGWPFQYDDCLDVPYGDVFAGRPIWTWSCNGSNGQRWRQMATGTYGETGQPLYRYVSMAAPDSGWVMQFNNGDPAPHLVMVPVSWSPYQMFYQLYTGP